MSAKRHPQPKRHARPKQQKQQSASGSGTLRAPGSRHHGHQRQQSASGSGTLRPAPKKRSAAGLIIHDGQWITGYNSEAPTCVPAAIANSLAAVTGLHVTDDDVMLMFYQAGGDLSGVSFRTCLAALATHGIGGHKPAGSCCTATAELELGDIIGLAGTHAACYTADGIITWGDMLDLELDEFDGEAWRIDWLGKFA